MTPTRKTRPASPTTDAPRRHLVRRRLGRRYWWLLSATGTSGLGNGLVAVAFPLAAFHLTHRPLAVAAVAVAGRAPWLVLSLPAGALADRVDRRRLVVTVELVRALTLGGAGLLVLAGRMSLPVLYGAAFALGALETASVAGTGASLPTLVDPHELPRANGYLFTAETAGELFAGPALGGLIYAWAPVLPFVGDAVSFTGSAAMLATALPRGRGSNPAPDVTLLADMRVGLQWFRGNALLRRLAPVITGFAFCQSAVLAIMVVYDRGPLHLAPAGYGLFLALAAVGDVAGNFLAPRAHTFLGPAKAIVGAGIAAATGYLLLAATSDRAVALLGFTLEGIGIALGNVATVSLRQRCIPAELFGRVNSVLRTCVYGALPLGALFGGLTAAVVGLQGTFLTAGVLQLLLLAGSARRLTAEISRLPPSRDRHQDHQPQTSGS